MWLTVYSTVVCGSTWKALSSGLLELYNGTDVTDDVNFTAADLDYYPPVTPRTGQSYSRSLRYWRIPGPGLGTIAAAAAGEGPSPIAQQLHSLQPHATVRDPTTVVWYAAVPGKRCPVACSYCTMVRTSLSAWWSLFWYLLIHAPSSPLPPRPPALDVPVSAAAPSDAVSTLIVTASACCGRGLDSAISTRRERESREAASHAAAVYAGSDAAASRSEAVAAAPAVVERSRILSGRRWTATSCRRPRAPASIASRLRAKGSRGHGRLVSPADGGGGGWAGMFGGTAE